MSFWVHRWKWRAVLVLCGERNVTDEGEEEGEGRVRRRRRKVEGWSVMVHCLLVRRRREFLKKRREKKTSKFSPLRQRLAPA